MAVLTERPSPPGAYPVVVIGSGPGGLQASYCLGRLGVPHALISADEGAGGMFCRWPLFERLITWTKPFAPVPRASRAYERYDWNSLAAEDDSHRGLVAEFMDESSYFPTRSAMERGIVAFAERAGIPVRLGCRWEETKRNESGYVVRTSDGEYRAQALVVATGITEPYLPEIPGIADVPHYARLLPLSSYRDRSVLIVGKRNSGFEIATGLLPIARRVVLASPSPPRFAIQTRTVAGVRARYIQPYEDHLLRGGTFVMDASIDRIAKRADGYVVTVRPSSGGDPIDLVADEVIAATGFTSRLADLPALGLKTFTHYRLPAQTPYWESESLPGVYFAGVLTQGALGLRKHGVGATSASVHGFRYNAIVLARHLAETRFGVALPRRTIPARDLVLELLAELTSAPELWLQRGYLARVFSVDGARGIVDEGIQPLQHFVESGGGDAVAATIELGPQGDSYPVVYLRQRGAVTEHALDPSPLLDFRGAPYARALATALAPLGIAEAEPAASAS